MNNCPWGEPQQIYRLLAAPYIVEVHTASHGGIWLGSEAKAMLAERTGVTESPWLRNEWYEEDLDAMIIQLAFWEELEHDSAKVVKWCENIVNYKEGYFAPSFVNYCQQLIDKLL
jgi:hypothetical protein